MRFITLPLGERDEVSIDVTEIVALRSHVVTAYSYVDYTEVTLRNGERFDCRIKRRAVEQMIQEAMT